MRSAAAVRASRCCWLNTRYRYRYAYTLSSCVQHGGRHQMQGWRCAGESRFCIERSPAALASASPPICRLARPPVSPAYLPFPVPLPLQGAEKLIISKMLEENSNRRTFPVDRHAGVAVAGVAADGRSIVSRAMAEANNYKNFYGDPIPGHVLAERLGSFVHLFNLYS